MWERIGRHLFGITPERIREAEEQAARLAEHAAREPYLVQRQVLMLLPKARLFEWHNEWCRDGKGPEPADPIKDGARFTLAFLIPVNLEDADLKCFIEARHQFFLDRFANRYAPKERWSWIPSAVEFSEWFQPRIGTQVWDLEAGALEKEPDVVSELMRFTNDPVSKPLG